ncbi:hypothetical protein VTN77DRAFT_6994 [Rasamsonia byssochlamydoides]|uniref:uncharacterized protein n=1 Tax=Rasamsonia byssochlamydoides TaxID=89139 RepID=UPI003741F172
MAGVQRTGLGLADLEKELVCSICTELLYQPLTLLDCLHTFCGSCLKEWFSWQAGRPRTSRAPRYTCPSCRAAVRETRRNATVTTLLDMVLQADPSRARSAEEKTEIAKKYKPGDPVLPAESSAESSDESDEEDRRLLEEVRELSLRDVGGDHGRRPSRSRTRDRRAGSRERSEDERPRRRHEEERRARRHAQHHAARNAAHAGGTLAESGAARRIEHQSSLRSLLSSSDMETTAQEEIVRQIIDEGLLDGIDLDNLTQAQEEELSDRLAQIYLSRHPDRLNLQRRSSEHDDRARHGEHRRSRSQTIQSRSAAAAPTEQSRHPPVSRPHLLEATNPDAVRGHRRRASDQENRRRRTSPTPTSQASASEATLRPAVRSSTDTTSQRPRPSPTGRPRTREPSNSISRHVTEPEGRISEAWMGGGRDRAPAARQIVASPPSSSPVLASPAERGSDPGVSADASIPTGNGASASNHRSTSRPVSSRANRPRATSIRYLEPSIACDRCGRENIQYDLHKHCPRCQEGKYHLCLRCYRLGRGCLHWFGFGLSGQANFEKQLPPAGQLATTLEPPHTLRSQRYRRPEEGRLRSTSDGRQMTSDDPANRLEEGMFCDICQSLANDCFWQCSQCNEGEWGFCQRCVNQGRCCNHPLLPIRRAAADNDCATPATPAISTSLSASLGSTDVSSYHVLSFSTKCDICAYPIPPSSTQFHCLECNEGDYDVCTNCYLKLVTSGKISKENGHNGWRRCLKGHRMIVVGFEDQRRVVVRDLVGGHTFKDDYARTHGSSTNSSGAPPATGVVASPELGSGDWSWKEGQQIRRKRASRSRGVWPNTNNTNPEVGSPTTLSPTTTTTAQGTMPAMTRRLFPPDGGVGLVLCALWSYYPEDDVSDELSFPRGAEITEAENINDEWYWGYYAGSTGLFPGAYGAVIREVS